MASSSQSVLITNENVVIPSKSHQLKTFHFPKRSFGRSMVVERTFQQGWFNKWPFLHYDECIDSVFCPVCLMSFKLKRMKSSTRTDPAFVTRGFHNWKDARSDVVKRISELEPRAIFTHCYGHALNFAACDTLKKSKVMKNALELTHEITKLIKCSSRREGIFKKLKETIPSNGSPGIRILCLETVRAESLSSIINNFKVLQAPWEEPIEVVQDSETKTRIRGVAIQIETFDYFFGNLLGQLILKHADNLSITLQRQNISASEGEQIAKMTVETLELIPNDESYDHFWKTTTEKAKSLDIGEPCLPRCRKVPARYEDGMPSGHFHDSTVGYYKQIYFEALDLIINCIEDRFDQPGFRIYYSIESLLVKFVNKRNGNLTPKCV